MAIDSSLRPSAPTLEQHNTHMPAIAWTDLHDGVRIGLVDGFPGQDVCRQVNVDRHLSLAMMIKGSGHFLMDGMAQVCSYDSGFCYLTCAADPFTCMDFFPAYHDLKLVIVHFSLEWLAVFTPLMEGVGQDECWFIHPQRRAGVRRLPMNTKQLAIAEQLMSNGTPGNAMQALKLHTQAMELLWGIAQRLSSEDDALALVPVEEGSSPRINRRERRRLLAARAYIQEHCLEPLQVADISQKIGIGHGALKRQFHELFGTSVYSYVLDCRLEHASRLLRESDLPVKNIAWRCGFAHSSHLSRLFRQRHGMSPKMFRER